MRGTLVLVGLAPDGLRLRLYAGDGVEQRDRTVEHAQRALDLDGEVDVARRVDDVDPMIGPLAGGRGRRDRDAALLLLLHPVHRRGALVHLAHLVGAAGVVEDALGRRRLARIDVGHDPDVPGLFERELARHGKKSFVVSVRLVWVLPGPAGDDASQAKKWALAGPGASHEERPVSGLMSFGSPCEGSSARPGGQRRASIAAHPAATKKNSIAFVARLPAGRTFPPTLALLGLLVAAGLLIAAEPMTLRELRTGYVRRARERRHRRCAPWLCIAGAGRRAARAGRPAACVRRSVPAAAAALVVALCAAFVVAAIDRPALDDTGLVGPRRVLARAHAGPAWRVEVAGAVVALASAGGALALAVAPEGAAGAAGPGPVVAAGGRGAAAEREPPHEGVCPGGWWREADFVGSSRCSCDPDRARPPRRPAGRSLSSMPGLTFARTRGNPERPTRHHPISGFHRRRSRPPRRAGDRARSRARRAARARAAARLPTGARAIPTAPPTPRRTRS